MEVIDASLKYYREREHEERGMAAQAPSDDIQQIHLTLAEKYRELADEAERRP